MRITLIRHGQPMWVDNGEPTNDPVLTELGRRQAEAIGARAARWTVDTLLVSPLHRTRETAAPLIRTTDAEARFAPWLEEIRGPDWSDIPAEEIADYFERARARHPEDWWDGMPGGEDFRSFHNRVWLGMERFLAEGGVRRRKDRLFERFEDDSSIVIVAHGGTNALLLGFLLGLEPVPWEWERFPLLHASVTVLHTDDIAGGTTFQLRSFNDLSHLERSDRSR
jgi:broad specificity phosphatase PhoE